MKKKILSSKDQKDFLNKIEDRSVTTSATVDNNGTELDTWEKPRKKSVQKPKEKVQLSVFNRFSYWEDANGDESGVEIGNHAKDGRDDEDDSKKLTCTPKDVQSKWTIVKCQSERQRVISKKKKKNYKSFETYNSFHDFQQHTEDDIEMIANGTSPIKSEITKCNSCNFKRGCSTNPSKCKAIGKKCNKCLISKYTTFGTWSAALLARRHLTSCRSACSVCII